MLGLIWYAVWLYVVASSPLEDKRISPEELKYITQSQSTNTDALEKMEVPWKAIVTSVPMWAIVAAHFAECWGFYTLLTELPKFMSSKSIKLMFILNNKYSWLILKLLVGKLRY